MRILYTTVAVTAALLILASLLGAQLPPSKQVIEQQYNQERAAGTQNPAPPNPQVSFPTTPLVPFAMGIIDDSNAPFSPGDVSISNRWQGILNGVQTVVYAGADAGNPQQGIVIVMTLPDYPAPVSGQRVLTPIQGGTVTIVAAQSPLLTLVSDSGDYVLTFNMNTRTFAPAVVVPLSVVPPNQVSVTTSGLAYSRVTQTFNGTVTIKNISNNIINVPLQVVFTSLTAGVTLVNRRDVVNGAPYITASTATTLAPGQTATVPMQFNNPSNGLIKFVPVIYSGSF
jgi:hypothetical protein